MTHASSARFCPLCGGVSHKAYCDKDGTRTVARLDLAAGSATLEINEIIDARYRITGLLGRGGFGAVYAAEHTGTGQAIALKVMVVGDGGSPDMGAVRRFYKEAQVTAQLRHPNTVRVFDVGQTERGALFIAMELLHGDTLERRMEVVAQRGQALGQRSALSVGTAVLRSLAEAHGQGLVHRDLKPANIIIRDVSPDEEPIPTVLDFGIARTTDSSLTGRGVALGTPAYMSPEQCLGAAVDGRSDLYSLGVILYRCVTGRLPFEDSNPLTVMFKHAHATPPPVEELVTGALNPKLVAVIQRAMAKKPDDRFNSAKEMRLTMEAILPTSETKPYDVGDAFDSLTASMAVVKPFEPATVDDAECLGSKTLAAEVVLPLAASKNVTTLSPGDIPVVEIAAVSTEEGAPHLSDHVDAVSDVSDVIDETVARPNNKRGNSWRGLIAAVVMFTGLLFVGGWLLDDGGDQSATGRATEAIGVRVNPPAANHERVAAPSATPAPKTGALQPAVSDADGTKKRAESDSAGAATAVETDAASRRPQESAKAPPGRVKKQRTAAKQRAEQRARRRAGRLAKKKAAAAKRAGAAELKRAQPTPLPAIVAPKPAKPKKPKATGSERPEELD